MKKHSTKKVSNEEELLEVEDIHKALDEMELNGDLNFGEDEEEETTTISKAKKVAKKKEEEEDEEGETNAEMEEEDEEEDDESEDDDEQDEENDEEEEEEKEVVSKKKKEVKKAKGTVKKSGANGDNEEVGEEIEKAIEVSPVLRRFDNRLQFMNKSQNQFNKNLTTVIKGLVQQNEQLLEMLEDQKTNLPPMRKGTTRPVERFAKGDQVAKLGDGKSVMNQRIHKAQILELLDEMAFGGTGIDENIAKAMISYEINEPLSPAIIARVQKDRGVQII